MQLAKEGATGQISIMRNIKKGSKNVILQIDTERTNNVKIW